MSKISRTSRPRDAGSLSLPKMLFEKGYARGLEAARNSTADTDITGEEGRNVLAGGSDIDLLAREGGKAKVGHKASAKSPLNVAAFKGGDFGTMVAARLPVDLDALMNDPAARAVIDTRIWPVPGRGQPAKRGAIGPNGRSYFDGRYSPAGAYRRYPSGESKPHYGIDLPAAIGTDVVAADDGVVFKQGYQAKGWGNYVAIRHGGGRVGVYAHLDSYAPMPIGTKIVQGQKIGKVGVSGNAGTQGSHLHYEAREGRGGKTLAQISANVGAASVNPTDWIRTKTVAR